MCGFPGDVLGNEFSILFLSIACFHMDRRSWPWKKKSSERVTTSSDHGESSPTHSSQHSDNQDVSKLLVYHSQISKEVPLHWQEYEQKIKELNEKLSTALQDVRSKDILVTQHAKVAEDAVSGWEKAEQEAALFKQQLDSAFQQKLAAEDRVSHLDGALKECMWQLRYAREQQEEKIHEAVVKKSREWEKVCAELEDKLADAERRFLERDAENVAISKSLQERALNNAEISQSLSQAEAEVSTMRVQLESMQQQNVALNYKLNSLNKELEIRLEENNLGKRAADAASKQHLEDIKKISKLEAECQRLRTLVRKKLPHPGAIVQMRMDIIEAGKEKSNNNKRSCKGGGSPRISNVNQTQEVHLTPEEINMQSEHLTALEEETKMLKELLAKRTGELQSARLICARTVGKLSSVEEQLKTLTHSQGALQTSSTGLDLHVAHTRSFNNSQPQSVISVSEDGNDDEISCAESWASALIAELDQFKKGKPIHTKEKISNAPELDIMDDFAEMERLASLPSEIGKSVLKPQGGVGQEIEAVKERVSYLEQDLLEKDAKLQKANQLYEEVNHKLAFTEGRLAALQSENAANLAKLESLQQKLDAVFKAQDEGSNIETTLHQIRADKGFLSCSVSTLQARIRQLSISSDYGNSLATKVPVDCSGFPSSHTAIASAENYSEEVLPLVSEAKFKLQGVGPELTSTICKVIRLVEDLAIGKSTGRAFPSRVNLSDSENAAKGVSFAPGMQFIDPELDTKMRQFISTSNQFLHGEVDLLHFMVGLSLVLKYLSKQAVKSGPMLCYRSGETGEFSGSASPLSDTCNSDYSERGATKVVPADESEDAPTREELLRAISKIEEELRVVRAEKVALETHMRAEFGRLNSIEQELAKTIKDRDDLVKDKEKLEHLQAKLYELEQLVTTLTTQLASAEASKNLAEAQLSNMAASKSKSDKELETSALAIQHLQEKVEILEKELSLEHRKRDHLEVTCQALRDQLFKSSISNCSQSPIVGQKPEPASKELEIAEAAKKLAECQQNILVLGQQLQALTSPATQPMTTYGEADCDTQLGKRSLKSRRRRGRREEEVAAAAAAGDDKVSIINSSVASFSASLSSCSSDMVDSELMSLTQLGMTNRNTVQHQDYIEAVLAQMPSSDEEEEEGKEEPAGKVEEHHRHQHTPSSFTRFFSRANKSSH